MNRFLSTPVLFLGPLAHYAVVLEFLLRGLEDDRDGEIDG